MSEAKAAAPDLGALARRQLHVIIMLDCSGSMAGDRIASLNYALRSSVPELKEVAQENPEIEVLVRVLRFADTAEWMLEKPVPVADWVWEDVSAGGDTHLGAGLEAVRAGLNKETMPGRQLPPVIVLASDGYPSDAFEEGLAAFQSNDFAKAAVRMAIAIGGDADLEVLQMFINHPSLKPLRANNAPDLVEFIKWATTAPVKAASSPTGEADPQAALAGQLKQFNAEETDIVW
ncbi:MAG: VWA domain-containing protein [Pseudomonadota bacterium]